MESVKRPPAAATGIVMALVLAALLAAAPVEASLRARVSSALDAFRAGLERQTGLSLSFGGMSPSILKSITISDLEIRSPDGGSSLRARRAWLYFDLGALLRGRPDALLTGLGLEGAVAELDARDLPRLEKLFSGGSGGAVGLPRIGLTGKDISLSLSGFPFGPASLAVERFALDGKAEEPSLELGASLALALPGAGSVDASLSASCLLSRDLGRLRGEFTLAGRMGDLSLREQRVAFSYASGRGGPWFELRKVRDAAPLDASFIVDPATGRATLSLSLDGYSPGDALSLSGTLASFEPWLSTPLAGSLVASAPLDELGALVWTASLGAVAPAGVEPALDGFSLSLEARGDLARVEVGAASLGGPGLSLSYRGSFAFRDLSPDGVLELSAALPDTEERFEAKLSLFGGGTRYALLAERVGTGSAALRDLVAYFSLDRGLPDATAADFSLSALLPGAEAVESASLAFSGEATPSARAGRIEASGRLSLAGQPGFEVSVGLSDLDLAPLRPLGRAWLDFDTLALLSSLSLDGEVVVRSDFSHLSYSATDFAAASTLLPGAFAILSFSGTERELKLRGSRLSWGGTVALASGAAQFSADEDFSFTLSLEVADLPYQLEGRVGAEYIQVAGDYGLDLSLRPVDGVFYVKAKAAGLPFPLPGIAGAVGLAAFELDGRFASAEDWRLLFSSLSLDPAGATLGGFRLPRLELSGSFGPTGGSAGELAIQDGVSRLAGKAEFGWDLGRAPFLRADIGLAARGGESLKLAGRLDRAALTASLDVVRSPLSRFLAPGSLAGSASGRLAVSGSLESPVLELSAELVEGSLEGKPLALAAAGTWREGILAFREGLARWNNMEFSGVTGTWTEAASNAKAVGRFRFALGDAPLTCEVSANASLGGPDSPGIRVDGMLSRIALRAVSLDNWPFSVESRPDRFTIEGGQDGEFSFASTPTGSFSILSVAPFPVRMSAKGRLVRGELEAEAASLALDLPSILPILGKLPVAIPSGFVEGSLAVRGALADPEFSGLLRVKGIAVDVPDFLPDRIGPLDGSLIAEGKRLILAATPTRVGAGRATATFEMGLDGWIPSSFSASLRSDPTAALRVRTQILGILVDGSGIADLRLKVDPATLSLGGSLILERSDVVLSPGIFSQGQGPWVAPAIFLDVTMSLGFGQGVRMYFPARDFPIVAGQVDPASSLAIRYDQAKERVSVRGDAVLRGGDVFYIQRDFFLRSATIRFNESAEKFDPLVTLNAELRDSNEAGPVLVTLRADNAPIANFKPRITSDPPMTESQIVALLGGRLLGSEDGGNLDIRRAAIAGAEFVPQLNITKAFESRVRETLGLDVFYLSTRVLQRFFFDVAGAGSGTGQGDLATYLDETSAFAGKYLGEGIFAHAEARLAENPLEPSRPLRLDSEFGVEFDTPFGLLTWGVSPKDPQNLFIGDMSVGLSWRFSY